MKLYRTKTKDRFVLVALLAGLVTDGESASDKDLIRLIRESNDNSRASIRTIHARLETIQTTVLNDPSLPPSEPSTRKVEWWQDGDDVRCSEEETRLLRPEEMGPEMLKRAKEGQRSVYMRTDSAIHAGVLTMIALQRNPDGTSVTNSKITYVKDTESVHQDIWYDALFVVLAKPRRTLAELLTDPSQVTQLNFAEGDCARGPYHFGPGRVDNLCDTFHYWSLHPRGANFLLADGSVHFIAYSGRTIMSALSTRAGGEAVTEPY